MNNDYQSITSTIGIKSKEVVITKKKQNTDYANRTYNKCEDYVCRYNILDSPIISQILVSSLITGKTYFDGKGDKITC